MPIGGSGAGLVPIPKVPIGGNGAGLVPIATVPIGGNGAGLVPMATVPIGGNGAGLVPMAIIPSGAGHVVTPTTLRRIVTVVSTTNNASKIARLKFFTTFLQNRDDLLPEKSLCDYFWQVNTKLHISPYTWILAKRAKMSSAFF